jgi:hypothetical protein
LPFIDEKKLLAATRKLEDTLTVSSVWVCGREGGRGEERRGEGELLNVIISCKIRPADSSTIHREYFDV